MRYVRIVSSCLLPKLTQAQHFLSQTCLLVTIDLPGSTKRPKIPPPPLQVTFQLQRKSIGPSMESDSRGDLAALLQSASKEQLVIGGPTRQILERVVQEAMDSYYSKQEGLKQTVVQRWHARDNYWLQVAQRVARPIGR